MAIDIDGLAVLRAIVGERQAFPDIGAEVNKAARALVAKQLKAKSMTLDHVRRVRQAIGDPAFVLVIEGFSDAETKGLAAKLDKHHPQIKTGSPAWQRQRVAALAAGTAEPEAKPAKGTKPAKDAKPAAAPKPKVERALSSKAMASRWDGKDRGK